MAVAEYKGNPYKAMSTDQIPPPPPFGIEGPTARASVGVLLRIVDGEGCCSEADAESLDEGVLEVLMEAGVDALLRKDYADALATYQRASILSPDNPTVKANLLRLSELLEHDGR